MPIAMEGRGRTPFRLEIQTWKSTGGGEALPSYDLVYIVKPDLESEAISTIVERATRRLLDQGATIEHTEVWGKRRMAYSIQRYREGYYVFTRFAAPGDRIPEIRHGLKIVENVLRASITVAVGPIAPPKTSQPPAPTVTASASAAPSSPSAAPSSDAPPPESAQLE